ncbi:MAG: cell division protein ZapA [Pseudomonadota bacterium]
MPEIEIAINNKPYRLSCLAGEESRLGELSQRLNVYVDKLRQTVGQAGEARLLVIVGLTLLDELESVRLARGLPKPDPDQPGSIASANAPSAGDAITAMAERIKRVTQSLENLAAELENKPPNETISILKPGP